MPPFESLNSPIEYLYSLESLGIKPGLERIRVLCDLLGNPQNSLKCIIVGGTNGKGSTVSFLNQILQSAGYKVAVYTSPHIHKFNERISINNISISDSDVKRLSTKIKSKMDRYNNGKTEPETISPTFFEFTTALAFEYFKENRPDIAVLEVGLGGLYDAVNIADPMLSIITNVSIDHTDFMGNSIIDIAREKAGIIRPKRIVITAQSDGIPFEVVEKEAKRNNTTLLALSKDFFIEKKTDSVFDYHSTMQEIPDIKVSLIGDHQFKNASLAICASLILKENYDYDLSNQAIYEGLRKTYFACRLEEIKTILPFRIILDGAHNHAAALTIANEISKRFKSEELTIMLGIMGNKEFDKMMDEFSPIANRIVLVRPEMKRAWGLDQMKRIEKKSPDKFKVIPDIESALDQLKKELKEKDTLLITGSIFTVSHARALLIKNFQNN